MTTQQKKTILLALRNAAKILEEELEENTPVLLKRESKRSVAKSHIQNTVALGFWRKPENLRKTHR
jgi:hypothetical protein